MTTRKERLLKKYLEKKKKQRNRDDLYAQIVALSRPKEEVEKVVGRRKEKREYRSLDEVEDESVSSEDESVSSEDSSKEGDIQSNMVVEEITEEDSEDVGDELMGKYFWDVHVRNMDDEVKIKEDLDVQEKRDEDTKTVSNETTQAKYDTEVVQDSQKALSPETRDDLQEHANGTPKEYETRIFENRKEEIESHRKKLPIYYERAEIIHAARKTSILFIKGATGCGKTTQIPQFLYEGGFGIDGIIGVTQPRRLSAISIANRINEETNEDSCGYRIKYESTVTSSTKIEVMTDGILIREIQEDFLLSRYSMIIIDEVHERSTNIDLLISIIPRIMRLRKENGNELKLVLMSATGNIDEFKTFLGEVDVFTCPEQGFPVNVFYEDKTEMDYLSAAYERIKKIVLAEIGPGKKRKTNNRKCSGIGSGIYNDKDAAILVFLTGKQDIYQLKSRLDASGLDITVLPLHSALSKLEQDLAFEKASNRKVILSTNIAETSITIPDVVFVIDSGKAKNRMVDQEGLVRYSIDFITKSNAMQRMGRAGRTGPGICYRLYSGEAYEMFYDSTEPQILREPLDDVVLSLLSLGIRNIYSFPFLSKPSNKAINDAIKHLQNLGAIDKDLGLTSMGKMMSKYPVEPRLARLLCIHGSDDIFLELVAVVSLIALNFEVRKNQDNTGYFESSKSDFLAQLNIYNDFLKSKNRKSFCSKMNLSYNIAVEMTKMISHLLKIAKFASSCSTLDLSSIRSAKIRKIIYCGFVDHLVIPSSNSHFFRTDEVFPSNNGISIGNDDFVVFESLVSGKNKLYMRNITVVDKNWF